MLIEAVETLKKNIPQLQLAAMPACHWFQVDRLGFRRSIKELVQLLKQIATDFTDFTTQPRFSRPTTNIYMKEGQWQSHKPGFRS
jgi:hypothetical protein